MLVSVPFALFGLIVGSFLNVLILREGKDSILGRSRCPSCSTTIGWYDLVPLISWVYLRGRCRVCGASISLQYPLVEGGTAALFLLIGLAPIAFSLKLLALPIAALFFAIAVYDFRTTYIPDRWVAIISVLVLGLAFVSNPPSLIPAWETLFAGPVAGLPLFFLWAISHGTWMGFGDVKLSLVIGWLLGAYAGFIAVWFAFLLGALVAVPLLILSSHWWRRIAHSSGWGEFSRAYTMKSELPFGPFLVASCFIVWFAQLYGFNSIGFLYFF